MKTQVTVIGIGEDGLDGLSGQGRAALDAATLIVGGKRHLEFLAPGDDRETMTWSKDISGDVEAIAVRAESARIAVLASGDPLMHGIGVRLIHRLGCEKVSILPATNAFSLAAARMGWALADPMLTCLSVHALPFRAIVRHVQPGVRLLILSRDGDSPAEIAALLREIGYAESKLSILERMGGPQEKHTECTATDALGGHIDNLNTVAVTCLADQDTRPLSRMPGLPDDAFEHDGTITKSEVRAVTLAALSPKPDQVLWDIGAGSGTVAIEWLRAEPRAFAMSFEKNPERVARIKTNADRLGVPELHVVPSAFPPEIDGIEPAPHAIFIGGGLAEDAALIDACLSVLRPGGRLVANAVTLEAQARLIAAHGTHGGELIRIAISRSASVGKLSAMKPSIDVLQWRLDIP